MDYEPSAIRWASLNVYSDTAESVRDMYRFGTRQRHVPAVGYPGPAAMALPVTRSMNSVRWNDQQFLPQ